MKRRRTLGVPLELADYARIEKQALERGLSVAPFVRPLLLKACGLAVLHEVPNPQDTEDEFPNRLPTRTRDYFFRAARDRAVSVHELHRTVLRRIADDNLLSAVLDDGE